MKLRNLMYATMIACAFASCSKDDENIPTPDPETADATFSLKASNIATKAGETDETITKLGVYVFNADGTFATSKLATKEGEATTVTEVKGITVKAGQKKVVVVANEDLITVANLDALYDATKDFNETLGTFTMNSKTITVDLVAGKTNFLGYTGTESATEHYINVDNGAAVKLYRNVAKIVLGSLKVDASATDYPNAKLTTSSIFLLQGTKVTKLVGGADAWSPTYVAANNAWLNGVDNNTYNGWVGTIKAWLAANEGKKPVHNYVETGHDPYAPMNHFAEYVQTLTNSTEALENGATFYAYENMNADTNTLLVVAGKFTYGNLTLDDVEERYYSVAVGKGAAITGTKPTDGIDRTIADAGVLRNLQYNIGLTVKGPGYETPFGPDGGTGETGGNNFLDVKVQVVGFGQVVQNESIE